MNAVELHLPDGRPSAVWMCSICRRLVSRQYQPIGDDKGHTYTPEERDVFAKAQAERCCNYRCLVCGEKAEAYQDLCRTHRDETWRQRERDREAKAFTAAQKFTINDTVPDCMLYDAEADHWHRDFDDAEEWYADDDDRQRPAYLWLSKPVTWSPDVCGHIADQMYNHYPEESSDDIDKEDWKRLEDFVAAWWKDVAPTAWNTDHSRCLILTKQGVTR